MICLNNLPRGDHPDPTKRLYVSICSGDLIPMSYALIAKIGVRPALVTGYLLAKFLQANEDWFECPVSVMQYDLSMDFEQQSRMLARLSDPELQLIDVKWVGPRRFVMVDIELIRLICEDFDTKGVDDE